MTKYVLPQRKTISKNSYFLEKADCTISITQTISINHFVDSFSFQVFRDAFINQRKQYKLLKAYMDLKNDMIDEDEYDKIEEQCTIAINDYTEEMINKMIYNFLKNHENYIEQYEANEISELLGLPYKKVNKLLKRVKKHG